MLGNGSYTYQQKAEYERAEEAKANAQALARNELNKQEVARGFAASNRSHDDRMRKIENERERFIPPQTGTKFCMGGFALRNGLCMPETDLVKFYDEFSSLSQFQMDNRSKTVPFNSMDFSSVFRTETSERIVADDILRQATNSVRTATSSRLAANCFKNQVQTGKYCTPDAEYKNACWLDYPAKKLGYLIGNKCMQFESVPDFTQEDRQNFARF